MHRTECSFCDHANPAGSKFCNACGGPLHLATCPSCEALNDVTASVCHKCAATLSPSHTPSLAFASAHATHENTEGIAGAHYLEGSYTTAPGAGALEHSEMHHPSATPADFEFTGSRERSTLSDPALARNRITIAVLSFIGIVCVALGAYLYLATNIAEHSATGGSSTRANVDAGVQNSSTPSAELQRGAAPGPTNAMTPLSESPGVDVASRAGGNTAEAGKPPSTPAACTEILDVLGLCPPQAVQRR